MNKLYIGLAIVGLIALPVACSYISTGQTAATAPARVVGKTLGTDNIIQNYEQFFDINAEYKSRSAQIADHSRILTETTDSAEIGRLRMELSAMRQSCRGLANSYNANSAKMNKELFKDKDLPSELNAAECEA